MKGKILVLTLLQILCVITRTRAQPCIPEVVEDLTLSAETLSWSASENCPSTQYEVVIETGGVIEFEYTTDSLSLDVSFLKVCRKYTFTVTPIANHLMGQESTLAESVDMPSGTKIEVQNFTGSQIADDILIQWFVEEDYEDCVGYYRVSYTNEDSDIPQSVYMNQTGLLVEDVAQCMEYTFEITAFYNNTSGPTTEFDYTVPEKTNYPSLVYVRQDTLVINTTWSLESFKVNRCNVTALHVNGKHFNATVPIVDSPARPTIDVSITGLKANRMYNFNVSTDNSAGISPAFLLAVQTHPIEDRSTIPSIISVRQDITIINTTWFLESYSLNRCPVIAVLPTLNIPNRPTIDVTTPYGEY